MDDDHCFVGFDALQEGDRQRRGRGADRLRLAFHPLYLKAAVEAGKHVFVEKPHAIDPPGIRVVEQACEEAKKKNLSVVSGLCWRYDNGVQETMKRILDGAIGDIVAIQENYMRAPYRLIERRPDETELEYQCRNWYHFRWLSGDDVPQSLVHNLDKGAWALREEPPVKAFGSADGPRLRPGLRRRLRPRRDRLRVRQRGPDLRQLPRPAGCYNEVTDHFLGTKGRANVMKVESKARPNGDTNGPKVEHVRHRARGLFDADPLRQAGQQRQVHGRAR